MYLEHFKLTEYPFGLTPNTQFFCNLPGHQAALNVLMFSLKSGEGFIKIIGEVGAGKTLLCRKLLNNLDDHFITAYIPNPDLTPNSLRKSIAIELGIDIPDHADQTGLLSRLNTRLSELHADGKQVVCIIDEAQALPDPSLETLRLLSNLETESAKLLHIVLFAQPELDTRLNQHKFRQLKQRITFSHKLAPINRKELNEYLCHRLAIAGFTRGSLFNKRSLDLLYQYSGGIPRIINILCHKALLNAYGKGLKQVDQKSMLLAITDSNDMLNKKHVAKQGRILTLSTWIIGLMAIGMTGFHYLSALRL